MTSPTHNPVTPKTITWGKMQTLTPKMQQLGKNFRDSAKEFFKKYRESIKAGDSYLGEQYLQESIRSVMLYTTDGISANAEKDKVEDGVKGLLGEEEVTLTDEEKEDIQSVIDTLWPSDEKGNWI